MKEKPIQMNPKPFHNPDDRSKSQNLNVRKTLVAINVYDQEQYRQKLDEEK